MILYLYLTTSRDMARKAKLSKFKQDPNNYNKGTEEGQELLDKSIADNGAGRSMLAAADGTLIAGNKTQQRMLNAGIDDAIVVHTDGTKPVIVVRDDIKDRDDPRFKSLALADNRVAEINLAWDMDAMREDGWTDKELAENGWAVSDDAEEPEHNDQDPDTSATTVLGDVYQLGNHRLICGDSTSAEVLDELLAGELIDLAFTDPPYGVNYVEKANAIGNTTNHIDIASDDLDGEPLVQFLTEVFSVIADRLADYNSVYICAPAGRTLTLFHEAMRRADMEVQHNLVWVKSGPVLGRVDYNYQHEMIITARKAEEEPTPEAGYQHEMIMYTWRNRHKFAGGGSQISSTWFFPKPSRNDLHPTMKPVPLVVNAILNSTHPGAIVCDSFGGSGTTLIAAERTGRKARLVELEPHYCDRIVQRWVADMVASGTDYTLTRNGEDITTEEWTKAFIIADE